MLDRTPPIRDVDTPDLSLNSLNCGPGSDTSLYGSNIDGNESGASQNDISANYILKNIRIKNINRLIIGTLNINFIAPKFEQLKEVIGNYLDVFTIQETKIDESFPQDQFEIEGYHKPYRLDRDKHGGGVLIYVREDIPTKLLNKHNFTKNIEGIFIEINLRKTKFVFFGAYRSEKHITHGISEVEFFEQVGLALDVYSNYDKFLLAGDFNTEEEDEALNNFLFERNAKNLVKEKTCFKSMTNPSCIDLFITNSPNSFQHTSTVPVGLSDFHKMAVTVLKTTFPKAPPKVITYRDYKNFILEDFRKELRAKIRETTDLNYNLFETNFLDVLERHAPTKKKTVRQNNKPYMTKTLRKAIMRRKQKNYTNKLLKKERKKYLVTWILKILLITKNFGTL
jgi:exonuclease III